jgi:hypothetical protein
MRTTISIVKVDSRPSGEQDRETLESALQAAHELVRCVEGMAAGSAPARHASYGIARALAHTVLDMLHEIEGDVLPSPAR